MFEFSIKSSKNIKELNIVFEDSESFQIAPEEPKKDIKTSRKPKVQESKPEPEPLEASSNVDWQTIKPSKYQQAIIQKPEISDITDINVAPELQNLDI